MLPTYDVAEQRYKNCMSSRNDQKTLAPGGCAGLRAGRIAFGAAQHAVCCLGSLLQNSLHLVQQLEINNFGDEHSINGIEHGLM